MRLGSAAANALLAVVSVAATLTCSEAYLRVVAPELAGPPRDRALLSEFYRPNADGVFTWPPHRRVRYVRLHGEHVEYDVQFDSNDLGLVDPRDYLAESPAARRMALVGDSFTAGYHGGTPWVPALGERFDASEVRLYNLGIGGAGFQQFDALLASVARRVEFTDVVLVAISDDFQRPQWRLAVAGDEARFCLTTWPDWLCGLRRPYFHRIDLSMDPLARLAELSGGGRLALVSLLVHVARSPERSDAERERRIEANEAALRSIADAFGVERVSLVHLPVRSEAARGAYEPLGDRLAQSVEALGIAYYPALHACEWRPAHFFRHDEHPNAAGYARVAECVERHLRQRLAGASRARERGRG